MQRWKVLVHRLTLNLDAPLLTAQHPGPQLSFVPSLRYMHRCHRQQVRTKKVIRVCDELIELHNQMATMHHLLMCLNKKHVVSELGEQVLQSGAINHVKSSTHAMTVPKSTRGSKRSLTCRTTNTHSPPAAAVACLNLLRSSTLCPDFGGREL